VNTHEIISVWSVNEFRMRRGEISRADLRALGRELLASTSVLDAKAWRYLDTVVKPAIRALESCQSTLGLEPDPTPPTTPFVKPPIQRVSGSMDGDAALA
jgi:hypothetical protein